MKVGLIISTYNWIDALDQVLNSVKHQTRLPDEVIVCDDGSNKDTKNFVLSLQQYFPSILKYVWQEDKGFRAAAIRNKGINELSTNIDYVVVIDGDMLLHNKFIQDHIGCAEKNCFIQGSRVLISEHKTAQIFKYSIGEVIFSFFSKGIAKRKNTLYVPFLSKLLSLPSKKLQGIRTCNMSFWKEDLYAVNGFNEKFIGWGKEDTELVVRLFNNGVLRKNVKFSALAYHLYHEEKSSSNISINDSHLLQTINSKKSWCDNGLIKKKYNES